jgi:nucleotide-binding universal stress UspA family protein
MAIKDILVHVTDGADCAARLDAAVALAQAHGAHLTGLYTMWIPPMPSYVQAEVGADLIARQRALYEQRMHGAEQSFGQRTGEAGISSEWRHSETRRAQALLLHARYCDLVVMGRHEDASAEPSVRLVERVVLGCGKAVLLLPDAGAPRGAGRHALVAWNGSIEAVRAVDAALPLLAAAARVDVIAVDPQAADENIHGALPGADLCAHLARHGVLAEAQAVTSGRHGVGQTLLERARADGVDLLVMGAYGHARWRELVLGGATAHMLRHASIPLLMAH